MKKILLLLLISISGFSQTLDPSFDGDGIVKTQIATQPTPFRPFEAALQADGKIIYVGGIKGRNNTFAARFNTDGTKDASFNQSGFTLLPSYIGQSVSIQNDGKIVVGGGSTITRLLTDGTPDDTFNTNGLQQIYHNGKAVYIKKISILPDNRIIVTGNVYNGTNYDVVVSRLNPDGSFDTSFNGTGILSIDINDKNNVVYSHKIQSDGKIVLIGNTTVAINTADFTLARISTNGVLDTAFGNNGIVLSNMGADNECGADLEILPDGKIVAFGSSDNKFTIARYNADGNLDTTLDADGILILNHTLAFFNTPQQSGPIPKIKITSDNKILLSGKSNWDHKIIKLSADGSGYDNSFGTAGVAVFNDNYDEPTFLLETPDGRIITGGYNQDIINRNSTIKQIELNPNGSVISDTTKHLILSDDVISSIVQLNDQSVIALNLSAVTSETNSVTHNVSLIKFLANGTTDSSYGTSGILNLGNHYISSYQKIILLSDSSVIIATDFNIFKINPNGTLDSTFGTGGVLDISSISPLAARIYDCTLSNDNTILVALDHSTDLTGEIWDTSTGVAKLNMNGTLNNSFGDNGILIYRFNPDVTNYSEWPTSIILDSNNKIVIVGISCPANSNFLNTNLNICFSRLNTDGTFDNSFGTAGKYVYQSPVSLYPHQIAPSPENDYLISFQTIADPFTTYTHILKLNNSGELNTAFGTNGIANDFPTSSNNQIILQPDGKILKTGRRNRHASISRYNIDGSIDTTFGDNGEINEIIDVYSSTDAFLLLPDGKLLASGYSYDGIRNKAFVARYTDVFLGTINFNANQNTLLVYPNPIQRDATFEYTLKSNENISIDLIDLQGKIIKKVVTNQNQTAGKQTLQISLDENITPGNYFLKISSGKGNQSVQIIKK